MTADLSTTAKPSTVRPETLAMVAEWKAERERFFATPQDQPDDFLDRWLPEAAAMIDAGWNGYGIAPSRELALRYSMLRRSTPDDCAYALSVAHWIKAEAARRHAAGLHPNPFTNERPAVSAGTLPGLHPL